MKALIVYESMYGNTHTVADAVAEALGPRGSRGAFAAAALTSSTTTARPACSASSVVDARVQLQAPGTARVPVTQRLSPTADYGAGPVVRADGAALWRA